MAAYGIGQAIIFSSCGSFFFLSSFFPSPNLSGRRLDVYHTSTRGVGRVLDRREQTDVHTSVRAKNFGRMAVFAERRAC